MLSPFTAHITPVVRPGVLDIDPYIGGESRLPGFDKVVKLASNEGALGPSPKAMAAFSAMAGQMHRYPEDPVELRAAIARRHGIEAGQIVCGAGSDDLITLLVRAYSGPGDEVLQSRHGFLMYAINARAVGAKPVMAPEPHLTIDVDAMLAAVTLRTKIVFIANPNNPTGTYLPISEVKRLHAGLPGEVLLVIDSAYAEFVGRSDYDPGIRMVRSAQNVVMLRTFSKMYAMGGLRLGWAYCPPAVADALNRVRNPFNVNVAVQAAALAALDDGEFIQRCRAHNDRWLPWLTEAMRDLGIEVVPSVANFILCRFGTPERANAADAHLRSKGIIARKVGGYGLPDSIRITIGKEAEMQATVAALAAFVGQA